MLTLNKFVSLLVFSFYGILLLSFASCKTEGCTDPRANNFVYEADKDDGSCDYGGCTDRDALNFDPDAQYDNGTCLYNGGVRIITTRNNIGTGSVAMVVHVNGEYIGMLREDCNQQFPTCSTSCENLPYLDRSEGIYGLRYWIIRPTSSTTADTIYESAPQSMQIVGGECNIHVIE